MFLFVLFDSLVGKALLARSIELCLVDNQRSNGVTVVGIESFVSEARSRQYRGLHQLNLPLTFRRSGLILSTVFLGTLGVRTSWNLFLRCCLVESPT
jgi:hypothetical protein